MSHPGHQEAAHAASLPPSVSENRAPAHVPPPPASYTMKDGDRYLQSGPVETSQKGGGFWRGFCAGLCCYCCLDLCC